MVALWLLVPPDHDLPAALRLSSGFLQAQCATTAEPLPGFAGVLPPDSILNLRGTALTPAALEAYPWLAHGTTSSTLDAVQVSAPKLVRNSFSNMHV